MSYLRGPDRNQVQLLPPCLDDYVPANAPARFIDAYVEGLDFAALGFTHARPKDTGRPPYHPADLLKLYLCGYLHRVRSSRRLEAEAARNLEVVWLLRGVRPDFKTVADFRRDNRAAFKPLFRHFNLLCRSLDLFGAELVAIDGAKFKASNNTRRHYTAEQLRGPAAVHRTGGFPPKKIQPDRGERCRPPSANKRRALSLRSKNARKSFHTVCYVGGYR